MRGWGGTCPLSGSAAGGLPVCRAEERRAGSSLKAISRNRRFPVSFQAEFGTLISSPSPARAILVDIACSIVPTC